MKKYMVFILIIFFTTLAVAQEDNIDYSIKEYVNDYSNLLSQNSVNELNVLAKELHDSGKAEYAIVILDTLNGEDIGGFSYRLGEGVLGDKEKNNGLLLVVALQDRLYDIEVGRGLEPIIPDIVAGRIARNYLVPNFQAGDYEKGILETSYALKAVLDENLESEYYPKERQLTFLDFVPLIILLGFLAFMTYLIIDSIKKDYKKYKKEHKGDDSGFWTGLFIGSMMGRRRGRGGFGGSGSGGGFGGFSGGSFGGGGSRGGW